MGMFIKFDEDPECNWCGNKIYECTCGIGHVQDSPIPDMWGEIIMRKDMSDQFFVHRKENNRIFGVYLDNRLDGQEVEWEGEYLKLVFSSNGDNG